MKRTSVMFVFTVLITAFFTAAFAGNLIETGNFDEGGWVLREGAEIQENFYLNGGKALLLPGHSQAFTTAPGLEPGQFYRVDAWCMTRNMPEDPEGGYLEIHIPGVGSFRANPDNHGWEPVTAWFRAEDDKPFRIFLSRRGIPGGEVYFDNVSLRRCPDPNLDVIDFEDGTAAGAFIWPGPLSPGGPGPLARVVENSGPGGGRYSLLAAPALVRYGLTETITSGRAEFDFMVKLNGRGRMEIGSLRIDLMSQIYNTELRDGQQRRQSLGSFTPGRWYRFRGVIDLESQSYDIEVVDFEDELYSFSRRNLLFSGPMDGIRRMGLRAAAEGGYFDNIYLGAPRD